MTEYRAASDTRLMGSTGVVLTEPSWDWTRDWLRLTGRARELVANDPFAAAMVQCKLDNTHGPDGLRLVSLAQHDRGTITTADHDTRELIEVSWQTYAGPGFDASGQLTRKAFDRQLDWLATVDGEAFAVRVWKPGRLRTPFATAWRLIRTDRVCNPDGRPNDETLYHGIQLDRNGEPVALWLEKTRIAPWTSLADRTWEKIPWYAPDGTPNVVHRVGWKVPGMLRGISMFAPMLLLAKQLGGTIEAHVTAKRAQACNPVIYYVDDPAAAAKAARLDANSIVGPHTKFNPLQVYYAKFGSQVQFTDTKFNGQDLEAFLKIGYRTLCAVWQLPIEVVLCQMGEASLASARAGLDQVDRTSQGFQADHIEQASNVFDYGLVTELDLTGKVTPGPSGRAGLAQARYRRPPKYSTDRKKDAETMGLLVAAGVSPTTAFSMFGQDYEDETDQAIRDEIYKRQAREAAGIVGPEPEEPAAEPAAAQILATAITTAADSNATALKAGMVTIEGLLAAHGQAPAPVVNVHLPPRPAMKITKTADGYRTDEAT